MSDDTPISVELERRLVLGAGCVSRGRLGRLLRGSCAAAGNARSAAVAADEATAGTASPGAHSARVMPAGAPGSATGTLHSASARDVR